VPVEGGIRSGDNGRVDDERPESDIRKRAAWLLAMLAVVAGLFVLLSLTLFNTSGGGGTNHGDIADPPTDASAPAGPTTTPARSAPRASSSTAASPAVRTGASSGAVPRPSCPGAATCTVRGDVAGTRNAINAYRARSGKKAVPTTAGAAADKCALSSGSDCPSSFVWVRVKDLSGSGVVAGVSRFNSSSDLLDNNAKSFEVGWAYDPGSKSVSCALIRND
jgi:hypothetical protein